MVQGHRTHVKKVSPESDNMFISSLLFREVLRLATQAKEEGWFGDWDKRIERANKKLQGS